MLDQEGEHNNAVLAATVFNFRKLLRALFVALLQCLAGRHRPAPAAVWPFPKRRNRSPPQIELRLKAIMSLFRDDPLDKRAIANHLAGRSRQCGVRTSGPVRGTKAFRLPARRESRGAMRVDGFEIRSKRSIKKPAGERWTTPERAVQRFRLLLLNSTKHVGVACPRD